MENQQSKPNLIAQNVPLLSERVDRGRTMVKEIKSLRIWLFLDTLSTRLLRFSMVGWIAILLVGIVLYGILIPHLDWIRPRLQNYASDLIGVPVRIGQVTAHTGTLTPSLQLQNIALLDTQGREALRLPQVTLAFSMRSLLHLGFEQIYVQSPVLDIRRDTHGNISVGGLNLYNRQSDDSRAMDWFFTQQEFALINGRINWIDELTTNEVLTLNNVNVIIRNPNTQHLIRVDATPPSQWGQRFTVQGVFEQPIWQLFRSEWKQWKGKAYFDFPLIDVAELGRYASISENSYKGIGSIQSWLNVANAKITNSTTDIMLKDIRTTFVSGDTPLALEAISGRFAAKVSKNRFELATQNLRVKMPKGKEWASGDIQFVQQGNKSNADVAQSGQLKIQRIDINTVHLVASQLPLDKEIHKNLMRFSPQGLIQDLQVKWNGELQKPSNLQANGRITDLYIPSAQLLTDSKRIIVGNKILEGKTSAHATLAANGVQANENAPQKMGLPVGVEGLTIDFETTLEEGKAKFQINKGSVSAPQIFENVKIDINQLDMDARWKLISTPQGRSRIHVSVEKMALDTPDAAGTMKATWTSGDLVEPKGQALFPGLLDLSANLHRADATKVWKYLPLDLGNDVRHYVRDAVRQGVSKNVNFTVKGELSKMPFKTPKDGTFEVKADVTDVVFDYIPLNLSEPNGLSHKVKEEGDGVKPTKKPWPKIEKADVSLIVTANSLEAHVKRAKLEGVAQGEIGDSKVVIDNFYNPKVLVKTQMQGSLPQMVTAVNTSAIDTLLEGALQSMKATGNAGLKLNLDIPLENTEKTKVEGVVQLLNNQLNVSENAPLLEQVTANINFSERGFNIRSGKAYALGGGILFDGGMSLDKQQIIISENSSLNTNTPFTLNQWKNIAPHLTGAPFIFRVRGQTNVDALMQYLLDDDNKEQREEISKIIAGNTNYQALISIESGAANVAVSSKLQGININAPAPLGKAATELRDIYFEKSTLSAERNNRKNNENIANKEQIKLFMPNVAYAHYVLDMQSNDPKVIAGSLGVGMSPNAFTMVNRSMQGVRANISSGVLNIDDWLNMITPLLGNNSNASMMNKNDEKENGQSFQSHWSWQLLPNIMHVQLDRLHFKSYDFEKVKATFTQEKQVFGVDFQSEQVKGKIEYRLQKGLESARLFARLTHLKLANSETSKKVENLLDYKALQIPSLDIIVQNLNLHGYSIDKFEIQATNQIHNAKIDTWKLDKFNIQLPGANLNAKGQWIRPSKNTTEQGLQDTIAQQKTFLEFDLKLSDVGKLLDHVGMKNVIRKGNGELMGALSWNDSLLSIHYPGLNGKFNLKVEDGQFLKVEPGAAKLLTILSLQSVVKRLTLDFRDLFSDGFAFDVIRGDIDIENGWAKTKNLQMKGATAAVLIEGQANLEKETQDLKLVVIPEIDASAASIFVATAVNPAIGISSYLAQLILKQPLIAAATLEFTVTGSWNNPVVTQTKGPNNPQKSKENASVAQ